jgi:hypothetical protein
MNTKTCKHFNGVGRDKPCELGINIEKFRSPSGGLMLPCLSAIGCAPCKRFEAPSTAEVAADEAASKREVDQIIAATKLIQAAHSETGTVDCPACGKRLRFVYIAKPRPIIRAACETEGCLRFMS